MKTNYADRPITCEERYLTLCMYFDLDEAGKENAYRLYDAEEDRRQYLDFEFEDICSAAHWFIDHVFAGCIRFDNYAERWEADTACIYSGWGSIREYSAIPENAWGMCYEYDCMEAWNRHASRFAYLYRRIEMLDGGYEAQGTYALPLDWYLDRYQEELENSLNDVCDALNAAWDACERYTYTREFFEDEIERDDSEHWYTLDGTREFVRDASYFMDMDACHDIDVIFENRSPMRIYAREYLD